MNLKKNFKIIQKSISHAQHTIFISTGPISYPSFNLDITICKNFIVLQRSIGKKKQVQFQISKIHKKKQLDHIKKCV